MSNKENIREMKKLEITVEKIEDIIKDAASFYGISFNEINVMHSEFAVEEHYEVYLDCEGYVRNHILLVSNVISEKDLDNQVTKMVEFFL